MGYFWGYQVVNSSTSVLLSLPKKNLMQWSIWVPAHRALCNEQSVTKKLNVRTAFFSPKLSNIPNLSVCHDCIQCHSLKLILICISAGSLTVLFRSSPSGRYPGFAANVICYKPGVIPNCPPSMAEASNTWENQDTRNLVSLLPAN